MGALEFCANICGLVYFARFFLENQLKFSVFFSTTLRNFRPDLLFG